MYQHARAIDDSSHRDFCQPAKNQQAIDANRRRAMLQQQHSIDDSSHRDFCQLAKNQQAIDGFAVELSCNSTIQSATTVGELCCNSSILSTRRSIQPPVKQVVSESPAGLFELCANWCIQFS